MSIFYQCLFTINVHLLSMSIYYQCQFTINVHLLSMSIYCQSLFTINVHLLSMSVYYQCPFTINVHLLSMSVYYQCLFTIILHIRLLIVYTCPTALTCVLFINHNIPLSHTVTVDIILLLFPHTIITFSSNLIFTIIHFPTIPLLFSICHIVIISHV